MGKPNRLINLGLMRARMRAFRLDGYLSYWNDVEIWSFMKLMASSAFYYFFM